MGLRERERFQGSYLQFLEEQEFPHAGYQPDSSYFYHLTYSEPLDSSTSVTERLWTAPEQLFPSAMGDSFLLLGVLVLPSPAAHCAFMSQMQSALKAVDKSEMNSSFDLIAGR